MRQSGFTLLELSIVLVIIGLIIGGVTVGSELIRQAELQSITKDFQQYETAVKTFSLKYGNLPGDMPDASSYWPSGGTSDQVCANSNGLNGDGNGLIEWRSDAYDSEDSRSWQHLALAGMIPGSYSGKWNDVTPRGTKPGINAPKSAISGAGYWLRSTSRIMATCSPSYFMAVYGTKTGNFLELGKPGDYSTNPNKLLNAAAIIPAEAQSIDAKMDDGKMQTGRLVGRDGYVQGGICDDTTGNYDLDNPAEGCRMVYWLD